MTARSAAGSRFDRSIAMADPAEAARICVGRDATDIAFMTVFGNAQLIEQRVRVERLG